tara:strand:+ start:199 stop:648 length:450 start_codon:yes stop_codon:yes gene_type:complete
MLTPQPKKSQELTKKQQNFLDAYFAEGEKTFGNITQSLLQAGYSESSRSSVSKAMRPHIIDRAKELLATTTANAVGQIKDALSGTTEEPIARQKLRFEAATDILDRCGISKRQEVVTENKHLHAVVLLPAKKAEALDLSDVEAEALGNT